MKPDLTRPVDFTTYNGTDKICTRMGLPWRSFGEIKSRIFPKAMAGTVLCNDGFEAICVLSFKGRYYPENLESAHDLFYALPEKVEKTFWIGVGPFEIEQGELGEDSKLHKSKEDALDFGYTPATQIVPITLLVEE